MKEVFEQLIEHYRDAIIAIDKPYVDFTSAYDICERMNVHLGVCFSANVILDRNIYSDPIIKNQINYNSYWTKPPIECTNKEQIIKSLKKRIEIMESELPNL